MRIIIQLCISLLIIKLSTPLSKFEAARNKKGDNAISLSKVVEFIVKTKLKLKNRRRTLSADRLARSDETINSLRTRGDNNDPRNDQAKLIEAELKMALAKQYSSLYDRPYIQKRGRNDFLVIRPEVSDPFVTVIPNHIYYNVEKKCANWLDDCSLNGIRARLLKGVSWP